MALDDDIKKLSDSLKDFRGTGESVKDVFNSIRQEVTLAGGGFDEIRNSLAQAVSELGGFDKLMDKVRSRTVTVKDLNNKIASSKERISNYQSKIGELQRALTSELRKQGGPDQDRVDALNTQIGLIKTATVGEQKYARALEEAKMIAQALANEKKQLVSRIGQLISQIPGLSKIGQVFTDAGQAIIQMQLEGKGLGEVFMKLNQIVAIAFASALIKATFAVSKELTELERTLNRSRSEVLALKKEFAIFADNLDDAAINSTRLSKALTGLNAQLGTAFTQIPKDTLATFSKLTEIVGITEKAAANLAFAAQRTGASFRDVEEDMLGATRTMQEATGVAFNNKEILEATGQITGQIRSNLQANPIAMVKAVTAAKQFGAEMRDIRDAANSLLNFEQSIEAELAAELITGKQLNLERARALALAGDQEGLARELANQAGTFTEFSDLNVLQQNELAKAFGMQSDQLADILFRQETMNMNAEQLRAIGKGELADQLERLDAQKQMELAGEKFMVILGEFATLILPLVEGFASIVSSSTLLKGLLAGIAVSALITAVSSIYSMVAALGPLGLVAAVAGTAALMSSVAKAENAVPMREGGIVPARAGGVFANIGEGGQSEAVIPLNKLPAIMNNMAQNQQPIVVETKSTFNNFSESKNIRGLRMREMGASAFA